MPIRRAYNEYMENNKTTKTTFTATAPNGQVLARNTKSHTYNYAVLVMKTEETLRASMRYDINYTEKKIVQFTEEGTNEGWVATQTKRIAKVKTQLETVTDTWFDIAWRRDLASAEQEAAKIQGYINKGSLHNYAAVVIVPTAKVEK